MHGNVRAEIVEVAKMMYAKGMVNAFEGNVSVKAEGKIYITPAAFCKGFLTEEMIVVTDESGNVIEGERKASSEIKLHLALYKLRPDASSVVHAHPPYSTAHSLAKIPIASKAYPELIIAFDQIPVVKYGTPSTDKIYAGMDKYIHEVDVVLMENHGIVSVGKNAHDAFFKVEAAESIAKTLIFTRLLGGENVLPEEELDTLYAFRYRDFGRKKI